MPPETEQSNLSPLPINNTNSVISSSSSSQQPVPPNNSFATGQLPSNNSAQNGHFGLFTSCLPSLYSLFSPTSWHRNASLTDRQQQGDTNDNYEIALECIDVNFKENYIGGGNQSSVFKGKWNGREIALKKLNRASDVDIQKLVVLKHENIVETIGITSKEIYPCIIMGYCEKGSLFDLLRNEHVDKRTFLKWSQQIANGMDYLHTVWRIIHRDLKSPNVLVDSRNCLKICDFGSLYTWDKTFMQSAVMSVCGTSQWMCPEMLKNEPCNEKVDVWSYGVILWELFIGEIPYKGIASMAIMYGVGSGKLKLHLPKSLPDTGKLLLKLCFSPKPRNRPSFGCILGHLSNLEIEIGNITEEAWTIRKQVWKREVNDQVEKLRQANLNGNGAQETIKELEQRRMHELRHAEELKYMYQIKMDRVERMIEQVSSCLEECNQREKELDDRERQLNLRAGTVAPPPTNYSPPPKRSSGSVPELKSIKVKKPTIMRSNIQGQKTVTDIYTRAGQKAILTMEIENDEQSGQDEHCGHGEHDVDNNNLKREDTEEELYESDAEEAERSGNTCHFSESFLPNLPNIPVAQERLVDGGNLQVTPKRRISQCSSVSSSSDDERCTGAYRSHRSYGSTSHQNSFEEASTSKFPSRATSARSSMNFAQRQIAADCRSNRNSISHLPPYDDDTRPPFVCPHCAYEFKRNCVARISGISADSGVVSTSDERQMSVLTLESIAYDACSGSKCECQSTDLYRNQQARWSDGRIHRYHHRNSGQTPIMRQRPVNRRPTGSFTRNSPARRVTSATTAKRHRNGFDRNSTGCLEYVVANEQHQMPHSLSSNVRHVHTVYNSQPKLTNKHEDEEDEDEEMPQEESGSGLFLKQRCHEAIQEMDSSMSSKSNRSPTKKSAALMEQSASSTMASSLERSLEMGIADGLSDKEAKLKAVKSSFRTHRRCASNPTNMEKQTISRIVESTESDNDPVYC